MTITRPASIAAAFATALLLAGCSSGSTKIAAGTGHSASPDTGANSTSMATGSATTTSAPSTSAPPAQTAGSSATTSAPAHPAASGGTACSLVTENDVTTALRADPGQGSAFRSQGATQCQYGSYPSQVLLVNVLPSLGKLSFDRARHNPKLSNISGMSVRDVTGVGDQAFELYGPHSDAIYFTKGDALILVGLSTAASPSKGAALALAKIAASRL